MKEFLTEDGKWNPNLVYIGYLEDKATREGWIEEPFGINPAEAEPMTIGKFIDISKREGESPKFIKFLEERFKGSLEDLVRPTYSNTREVYQGMRDGNAEGIMTYTLLYSLHHGVPTEVEAFEEYKRKIEEKSS